MKVASLLFFMVLICGACEPSSERERETIFRADANEKPSEPCDAVSWGNIPVITNGYHLPEHENVVVETYVKNGRFDTLIQRYNILNNSQIDRSSKNQRFFNLPVDITSAVDLKIRIGQETYCITDVKTDWEPSIGHNRLGYSCEIGTFQLNGETTGGNITLINPEYHLK